MKTYVPLLELLSVVPGSPTEVTATLSVTMAVNVTVWLCDEVVRETVESSALKLVIDGSWSSLFVILTVTVCVELFPAASVAVAVNVSVVSPKL